jgi:hypothetical protein
MRRNRSPHVRGDERGQSTVEFALVIVLVMGFILFYVQLCLVFAWGNYTHYATFMAARAMQSAGVTEPEQRDRALKVAARMLKKGYDSPGRDRLPMLAKGLEGDTPATGLSVSPPSQFRADTRGLSWMEGVRYKFRSRLFLIPWLGSGRGGGPDGRGSVTLTSESWLGRSPSFTECKAFLSEIGGYIDNGC